MQIEARAASLKDAGAVREILLAAFGTDEGPVIAGLVEDLNRDPSASPSLELIASAGEKVVGHILFTNAPVNGFKDTVASSILAPLSVHPDHQGQGIGGQLIGEGLRQLREAGTQLVFVLGHPGYYPKYGFRPAGRLGLDAPYPILPKNADAWMVQELQSGFVGRIRGRVRCAAALDEPEFWQE